MKVSSSKGTSLPKAKKVILIPLTVNTLWSGPEGTFIPFLTLYLSCTDRHNDNKGENMQTCITN